MGVYVFLRFLRFPPSRFADNDRIDIQTRAVAIMKDYLSQPPQVQEATRSIYVRVLADMGLPEAEQDLPAAGLVSLALAPDAPGGGVDPTQRAVDPDVGAAEKAGPTDSGKGPGPIRSVAT